MHILWLVKTTLPQAAVACGLARASDVSGSWLTGQLAALRTHADLHLTVLSVGRANPFGTFIGALLIGVINNGMTLAGAPYYTQDIVKGLIILLSVAVTSLQAKKMMRN